MLRNVNREILKFCTNIFSKIKYYLKFCTNNFSKIKYYYNMAKCVSTSNYFWKIEDFRTSDKKDDGTEKFFLYLECLNTSEMSPKWQFIAAVLLAHNDGSYSMLKHAKYNLGDKEWCVWTDDITNIYKKSGPVNEITFYIRITPVDLENFLKNSRSVGEDYSEFLCTNNLSRDFEKFFNDDSHSDFILNCGERNFHVNKTVLSARSDFFAGMFNSGISKVIKGSATIGDVEPDILGLVLHYLYTGQIPELSKKSLQSVYIAADRFGVESLKIKCYSLLIDKFVTCPTEDSDTENVTKSAAVAKVVKASETQMSKETQLVKDLFVSREWRLFSHEFPQRTQEMCKSYLLKN